MKSAVAFKEKNSEKSYKPKQAINGVLLLDKPIGISSNAALQQVKHLFHAKKAGHTGSLDPLASGMLPICFGEATKFSQFLLDANKHYLVVAKLGIKTTTGDAEGEVVSQKSVADFSEQQILDCLESFKGHQQQVPSMYSALKHNGKPLYYYARQGITIERPARDINIYDLTFLGQKADTLTLEVKCSKGTYIRTFMEDIGDALGCGAHVSFLRRLTVGPYSEARMVTMNQLADLENDPALLGYLLPLNSSVADLPRIDLQETAAFYLKNGRNISVNQKLNPGLVQLFLRDDFIGVGQVLEDGKVSPKRLLKV